jgi:hypothetical protein
MKVLSNYQNHSKQIRPSLSSVSPVIDLLFLSFSLNTETNIGDEGAIKLSEALQSNTSLTTLNLSSNRLVASLHSHPIQIMILVMKEPANYPKHSNQIHLLQHYTSPVTTCRFICSHSVQIIRLVMRESSNYLKQSSQTHLSLYSA